MVKTGIDIRESNSNELKYNIITYTDNSGILIYIYSHYNKITDNTISNALPCILIGNSSYGTFLENNDACSIQTFEDVQSPPPPPPEPAEDEPLEIHGYIFFYDLVLVAISVIVIITTKKIKARNKLNENK